MPTPRAVVAALFAAAVLIAAPSAIRADGTARALVAEGNALAAAGDRPRALARYEAAIAIDGDLLEAYDAAAPLWIAAEQFATAIAHLERVTLRHPSHAVSWYELAYAYRRCDRWEAAIAAYEAYVALRPAEAAPWFGLAIARQRARHDAEAIAAYRQYLHLERDPGQAQYRSHARAAISALGGQRDTIRAWLAAIPVAGRLARHLPP